MVLPLAVGAFGSAIGGAALSSAGSYLSSKQSARESERMYKHRYQWQVKDMQKAGLNPMLAFSQGAPVPSLPHVPDYGESATKGVSAAAARSLINSQMVNIASDTELKQASARAQDANANKVNVETDVLKQFGSAKAGAEVDEIKTRIERAGYEMAESVSRTDLNFQEWQHNEKYYPIKRELEQALADAKQADIPLKEVVAMLASMFGSLIKKAKDETERRDYSQLGRDTINMVEDKWNHWNPWERFKQWDREKRGKK